MNSGKGTDPDSSAQIYQHLFNAYKLSSVYMFKCVNLCLALVAKVADIHSELSDDIFLMVS